MANIVHACLTRHAAQLLADAGNRYIVTLSLKADKASVDAEFSNLLDNDPDHIAWLAFEGQILFSCPTLEDAETVRSDIIVNRTRIHPDSLISAVVSLYAPEGRASDWAKEGCSPPLAKAA